MKSISDFLVRCTLNLLINVKFKTNAIGNCVLMMSFISIRNSVIRCSSEHYQRQNLNICTVIKIMLGERKKIAVELFAECALLTIEVYHFTGKYIFSWPVL